MVGHFPGSSYPVKLKNIHELVTHNAAILGILGIGKSMIAIELVERMIANGIKVICLDLTNQYAKELSDFYSEEEEIPRLRRIREAGEAEDGWQEDPEEGGTLPKLRQAILDDLTEFLDEDNPRYLKIYNPAEILATKQLREPKNFQADDKWHRRAALWSVTPVEITSIVAEMALHLVQDEMSDSARVCLVLEEAHSLVPEFGTVASEGDKAATNKTARAILQGRKYGFGCLLVTQRTANVTKTILNQCNTVFAMRTFDDTGKEFLSNYIGSEYAGILTSLQERQAVFFGKASSCENPVLIRLNDQGDFREQFRKAFPPPALVPIPQLEEVPAAVKEAPADELDDDDIPF
jgi:DNA helicase HerA-like ATPase